MTATETMLVSNREQEEANNAGALPAPTAAPGERARHLSIALLSALRARSPERSAAELQGEVAALLEQFGVGTFRCTAAGQLLESNDALRRLLGIPPDRDLGTFNLYDFFVRHDIRPAPQLLGGELAQEHELQLRRADGLVIWVALSALTDAAAPEQLEGLMEEISERKRAEEMVWLGEEYFRSLVEHAPELVGVIDSAGRLDYVNPAVQPVLGYTPSELVGTNVFDLLAEEDHAAARALLRGGGRAGRTLPLRLRDREGRWRRLEIRAEDLLGNPIVAGVVVAAREVAPTRTATRALRHDRRVLRAAGIARWEIDLAAGRMRGSRDLLELLGVEAGGFDGTYSSFLRRLHPADFDRVARAVAAALDEGSTLELECRVAAPDGTPRWLRLRGRALRGPHGRERLAGIAEDVSERQALEQQRREDETRFRRLVEASEQVFFFSLGADGRFDYLSPSVRTILGYKPAELLGAHFDRLLVNALGQTVPDPAVAAQVVELRHRDGSEVAVELIASPAETPEGGVQGFARDVSERQRAERQLLYDALHDALTGLPNRTLFHDRLQHTIHVAERHAGYLFAILIIDLDNFKRINDGFGHLVGDQLLVAVARRLERCLRPGDTVTRFGGDEFIILLQDLRDTRDATRVATRILKELDVPFNLEGREAHVQGSIGIALNSRADASAAELLKHADAALYRAKSRGRARYEVFDRAMHRQTQALLQMETDLRQARARGELRVVYQPVVSLQSGAIAGFEALLRWDQGARGTHLPADFLQLAEESGLILELDQWVMGEACRQLGVWAGRGTEMVPVSVNLSGKEFARPDLAERLQRVFAETGVDSSRLRLELRESALLENPDLAAAALEQLRELNVQLQIDDFGSGQTPLGSLDRFAVDTLKLDGALTRRLPDDARAAELLRALVTMAHSLGMTVVAKGAETRQQVDALRALGCDYAQGFYFAEPLAGDAIESMLARAPRW